MIAKTPAGAAVLTRRYGLLSQAVSDWRDRGAERSGSLGVLGDHSHTGPLAREPAVVPALAVAGDQSVDADPARGLPCCEDHDGEECIEPAHACRARHDVGEQQGKAADSRDTGEQPEYEGGADGEFCNGDEDGDPAGVRPRVSDLAPRALRTASSGTAGDGEAEHVRTSL